MSKFQYFQNLKRLINDSSYKGFDKRKYVLIDELLNLNNCINLFKSPHTADYFISLKELRDMGYKELKIDQHVLIDDANLESIAHQYEYMRFKPDIYDISNHLIGIVRDIQECRATIDFDAVRIGTNCLMDKELKDLEDLYYEFNRYSRECLHANQILTAMRRLFPYSYS